MQTNERKQVVVIDVDDKMDNLNSSKGASTLDKEVELAKYKFWGELLNVGKTIAVELLKTREKRGKK